MTLKRRLALGLAALTCAAALPGAAALSAPPADDGTIRSGSVYATVTDDSVVLGNPLVERTWSREAFATTSLIDKRGGNEAWSSGGPDFSLTVGAAEITSDMFTVENVSVAQIDRGLRVEMELAGPGINARRIVESYNGIAGFRSQTIVTPVAAIALGGEILEQAAVGADAAPTIHAFRAGADWRGWDEDSQSHWGGPEFTLGNAHPGTWRETTSEETGVPLDGPAQWISVQRDDRSLFMVMERNDFPSSWATYDGTSAALVVDHSRDIVVARTDRRERPRREPDGLARDDTASLRPEPTSLSSRPSSASASGPDDEPWQFYKYLSEHRLEPYDNDVTFNSNGTDANLISTGAKDDMNYADGRSRSRRSRAGSGSRPSSSTTAGKRSPATGTPTAPSHPEPRWDGVDGSKFAPRFPDSRLRGRARGDRPDEARPVDEPDALQPQLRRPTRRIPSGAVRPSATALVGANARAAGQLGSNEAGLGDVGPRCDPARRVADPRTRSRNWDVEYFKFDFLVWLDCVGQGDLYDYQRAFIGMLDRLEGRLPRRHVPDRRDERLPVVPVRVDHPRTVVVPERVARTEPACCTTSGTSARSSRPTPSDSTSSGGGQYKRYPVDTLMAAALTCHITFFSDLRGHPDRSDRRGRSVARLLQGEPRSLHADDLSAPERSDRQGLDGSPIVEPGRGPRSAARVQTGLGRSRRKTIALKNVPEGRSFDLFSGVDKEPLGTFTSEQLTAGLDVSLPEVRTAEVILILPHQG